MTHFILIGHVLLYQEGTLLTDYVIFYDYLVMTITKILKSIKGGFPNQIPSNIEQVLIHAEN